MQPSKPRATCSTARETNATSGKICIIHSLSFGQEELCLSSGRLPNYGLDPCQKRGASRVKKQAHSGLLRVTASVGSVSRLA